MIGLENSDTSFFVIQPSDDLQANIVDMKKAININDKSASDIINFSITEEMGKVKTGNLAIFDRGNIYSQLFKSGTPFDLIWGYRKNPYESIENAVKRANKIKGNDNIIDGTNIRYMKCYTVSPSGSGSQSGEVIYNATFYASYFYGDYIEKKHENISKKEMVIDTLKQMNIKEENMYIDYENGNEKIDGTKTIRQTEKPFNFLANIAVQDKILFDINFNQKNELIACFINSNKIDSKEFIKYQKLITGSKKGSRNEFAYKLPEANVNDVVNYNWNQNVGESGTGSSVRVIYTQGRVLLIRTVAGQQKTVAYEFNPDQIRKILELDKSFKNFQNLFQSDFETLLKKGVFTEKWFETAPEGFGFTINLELGIGNPNITIPTIVYFKGQFPVAFTTKGNTYYINKVTHKFDRSGYKQSIEIADTFTITGGSFIGAVGGMN